MSGATSLVPFFVGFILTATGVQATCPIELSPPRVVVKYGDPVSVNCSTSVRQHTGMGWEAKIGGRSLEMVNHSTWTVGKLTEWTISPKCFINLKNMKEGPQCQKNLNISLYTFPENISINSSSDSHGVMRENKQYNLTCHIRHVAPVEYLIVTWYKGDRPGSKFNFTKTPTKKPVDELSVYTVTPTRRDNGVTFRCEATMDLGPEGPQLNVSSQEINITVHYGPEVKCSDINILEGETLESKCPVEGNPTPSVRWMKDGKLMDPSHPLTRENAGRYIVEAQGASNLTKDIQVLVMYGPELMCPRSYTIMEHSPLNLNCTVKGYPEPKKTWYKDGGGGKLEGNLTRNDTGLYVITASNNRSSVNVTVEINVMYPPSLIVELEDSEVKIGSDAFLNCSSKGNPRPTYIWNYFNATNVMEKNEEGYSLLAIHNATGYNMGSYTCLASNKGGHVSKTVRLTVKDAKPECPIEITPHRMVIPYRGPTQTAACKPTSAGASSVTEISWEVHGIKFYNESWSPETREDWDPRPFCTATFRGLGPCQKYLNFTLYKTPGSVSIRPVHNRTSVVEGSGLQLQCDVISVAPAGNLTVRLYQGNDTLQTLIGGPMRVAGCLFENGTKCDISVVRSPVDVSYTINITANRAHNGVEFRCEAQMDLGPEGPQPPPSMRSEPLSITVHYKPAINTTKLPKKIPVFRGYPEELDCEADGHPRPNIKWNSTNKVLRVTNGTLTVSEAGLYNCTATNEIESTFYVVEVILKEDYLPLIAGFVAVTVVAISIVFLFIYSIYYKNTRMRRYSLKNPRLSTHNGNVAHNGWDMQFPMTKLS
ncbi:hemicentin-1-like [Platichthys flesus]|uniref:hemicentin-1-like n=1 Tax=Platichthys flesus TaxID=8260 RepID=UPI002DBCD8B5|nr:hemicentin-1-like [Platichthys flesus]